MRTLPMLTLALLVALALAWGSVAVVAAPERPSSAQVDAAPGFSATVAAQHVDALSMGIGSRVAGSLAQTQTHDYLTARFQELGYQVTAQPFPINAYQDRGSTVLMPADNAQVSANTMQFSTGGAVEGRLVEAGLGRDQDFAAVDARGAIALVRRGEIRFVDKTDAAARAGALAIIVLNNQPGNVNGSLIGISSIPAVTVAQEDGPRLQAAAAGGDLMRVSVDATAQQSTGANIVATRPGGPDSIVVGAHIDSVAAGPGANDNASGTAAMLELARVMATAPTRFTLTFVGFDAEEIGLVGSNYYVSQLSEQERQSIRAMINLDMVGVGTDSRVGGSDSLVRLTQTLAMRSGLSVSTMGEAGASDHASFIRAGIPGLFIHRTSDPNYHSPNDKAEFIDPTNLQIAGQLALDVIAALERGE